MRNEIAILMAAGLGSRMRPLTETIPKPLVPVGDTPMIETVIAGLRRRGVQDIYIVVGYLGEKFRYLEEKYDNVHLVEMWSMRVSLCRAGGQRCCPGRCLLVDLFA